MLRKDGAFYVSEKFVFSIVRRNSISRGVEEQRRGEEEDNENKKYTRLAEKNVHERVG